MSNEDEEEYERNIEILTQKTYSRSWSKERIRTSIITLIINYKDQLNQFSKMLVDEVGKASNIKSRVNLQNATDALTSTMEKLLLYNKTPKNGLVIYCGLVQMP